MKSNAESEIHIEYKGFGKRSISIWKMFIPLLFQTKLVNRDCTTEKQL